MQTPTAAPTARTRRAAARVALVVAWAGLCLAGCSEPARPDRPPNVLLISIDTLRADHLGIYGYHRETAPALRALAEEGALFERCSATANWTLPTHTSIFTGLGARLHGVETANDSLNPAVRTLPEQLSRHGYATAGFYSNPFLDARFGWARGFDRYEHVVPGEFERAGDLVGSVSGLRTREPIVRSDDYHVDQTSPQLLELAMDYLDERADAIEEEPFFLFVHFNDVHSDYIPPAPYDLMYDPDYTGSLIPENYPHNPEIHEGMDPRDLEHVVALYDGEISWVDQHIETLLYHLRALDLAEDTLVVVTADHGEGFFERRWKEHHYGLHHELVHIPWILRFPGRVPAGRRIERTVSQADIAPTILDLVDLPRLPAADGVSRAAWLLGDGDAGGSSQAISAGLLYPEKDETTVDTFALRTDEYAAIARKRGPSGPVRFEVYDRRRDPDELAPLPPTHEAYAPMIERLIEERARIDALREQLPSAESLPDDPELIEKMKEMGYIGGGG